jgi:hypothetical protein
MRHLATLYEISTGHSATLIRQFWKAPAAAKTATKRIARRSDPATGGQTQRDPTEERFRELVAWYVLEGVDETTARQRARQEMDSDLRKDRRR